MTRVLLVGAGAVGARAARQLVEADDVESVLIVDPIAKRRTAVVASTGDKARDGGAEPEVDSNVDAVLLAGTNGTHVDIARHHLAEGRVVVSTADGVPDVLGLLDLGPEAQARGVAVVAGAGFSPGYSCLLARHASAGPGLLGPVLRELEQGTGKHGTRADHIRDGLEPPLEGRLPEKLDHHGL